METLVLAGCAIFQGDSILLLHRAPKQHWELPGGKVDAGEMPEQTAVRELKEELCVDVKLLKKIGEREFSEWGRVMKYIWFQAELLPGQTLKLGEPKTHDQFKFVPISELGNYPLSPNMENLRVELEANF